MLLLDPRLSAAASLVREGCAVCDVGTDHGYLAVSLLLDGVTDHVTACDINEKPLSAAAQTAQKYGVTERLVLRLSDGLLSVPENEAEDIVICGMGGELIAKILSDCPYTKETARRLILQPMTQVTFLRRYLCKAGYSILRELPVTDKSHAYTVMHCAYTGERRECTDLFSHVGKIPDAKNEAARTWLLREQKRLTRIAEGLKQGGAQPERAARYLALAEEIAGCTERMGV